MSRINAAHDTTFNMESLLIPKPEYKTSILKGNVLATSTVDVNPRSPLQPDWIPGVLIFCFLLLAWNHVYNPKRFAQVLMAPFSKRFINQLVREGNLFNERIAFTLGILYLLLLALLLFELNEQVVGLTVPKISGILIFAAIFITLVVYTTVKVTLVAVLGIVFKTKETTYNYLLNQLIFAIIAGPILLVFLVLIVYLETPFILYFCLAVIAIISIFRFFRAFLIGMALTKFSYLLLFVYLCSLEILPLLVLLKLILNYAKAAVV